MPKLTKQEIAEIEARMAQLPEPDLTDPDNPEWTEEDFARAQAVEDLPEKEREMILAAFPNTRRRGPGKKPSKRLISLRLDPEVLERYQATGQGWQALINEDLVEASKRRAASK